MKSIFFVVVAATLGFGCGGGSSEADQIGVGAECTTNEDCRQDLDPPLSCMTVFAGGYCGLTGCMGDLDCPEDAICVTHTDSTNYCFRACQNKSECNENRSLENESNCSSNVDRVDPSEIKACVPPSSGS
jgi:hypothetical protein